MHQLLFALSFFCMYVCLCVCGVSLICLFCFFFSLKCSVLLVGCFWQQQKKIDQSTNKCNFRSFIRWHTINVWQWRMYFMSLFRNKRFCLIQICISICVCAILVSFLAIFVFYIWRTDTYWMFVNCIHPTHDTNTSAFNKLIRFSTFVLLYLFFSMVFLIQNLK